MDKNKITKFKYQKFREPRGGEYFHKFFYELYQHFESEFERMLEYMIETSKESEVNE